MRNVSTVTEPAPAVLAGELDRLLSRGGPRAVYQPIVGLDSPGIVGFEALARGPEGSALERPDRLFAAAAQSGRTTELDLACREAALRGALDAGLQAPGALFLNVEAAALEGPLPSGLTVLLARATAAFRVIVEVTERALTARPAELLASLAELRALGCGIALDDVGADERSLALMPFLRPDVIKLDMRFVRDRPSAELARIHNAVAAESERTGAALLAEGIETEEHVLTARALGATLGQGYLLGRPGPLAVPQAPADLGASAPSTVEGATSPFELVAQRRPLRRGVKPLLLATSRELERQATTLGSEAVVLSAFQEARHLTSRTLGVYSELARRIAFVGALGSGVGGEPSPAVRGAELSDDDPVRAEWDVIVIGAHFSAAFAARDLGDLGPDSERRFDFALTYERDTVVAAARSLMARIAPI